MFEFPHRTEMKPTGFHQIFVVKRWDVHTWNVWSGSPAEPSDDSWWPQSSPSPPRSPSPSHQAWGDREQTQAQSADAHLHVWTTDQKLEVQTTLKRCNTSINQNHFLIWGCYYTGSGTLYNLFPPLSFSPARWDDCQWQTSCCHNSIRAFKWTRCH